MTAIFLSKSHYMYWHSAARSRVKSMLLIRLIYYTSAKNTLFLANFKFLSFSRFFRWLTVISKWHNQYHPLWHFSIDNSCVKHVLDLAQLAVYMNAHHTFVLCMNCIYKCLVSKSIGTHGYILRLSASQMNVNTQKGNLPRSRVLPCEALLLCLTFLFWLASVSQILPWPYTSASVFT